MRKLLLLGIPILVLVRTDLIIWCLAVFAVLVLRRTVPFKSLMLSAMASIAFYLLVNLACHNPGWAATFRLSLLVKEAYPISVESPLTSAEYFTVLRRGVDQAAREGIFLAFFVAVGAVPLVSRSARPRGARHRLLERASDLALVCGCYVGTRFLLFPVIWDRFLLAPYLISTFCLVLAIIGHANSTPEEGSTVALAPIAATLPPEEGARRGISSRDFNDGTSEWCGSCDFR